MTKRTKTEKHRTYSDDDTWLTEHFEQIVNKYKGQHIVIANREIFTGENAAARAKKKYPHIIPISMPVPRPENFLTLPSPMPTKS